MRKITSKQTPHPPLKTKTTQHNTQASFFNHSCKPNASFYTDGLGCLVVVATADVAAGTQLCIPYISVATRKDTFKKRQEKLLKEYLFECRCDRCVKEQELELEKDDAEAEAGTEQESNRD